MTPLVRPKIGVVIPSDLRNGLPPLGGNLGFLYNLLPRLRLPIVVFGFEVDDKGPAFPPIGDHVRLSPVGKSRYPSSIPVRIKSLFWYWRARKRIIREVDVVYVQQLEATLPFLFGRRRIPVVYHKHDVGNPTSVSKVAWGSLFIFRWFFNLALRLVYQRADWIVVVSESCVEEAHRNGAGDRVTLLRNCVDNVEFHASPELRSQGRAEFGLTDSHRVVLISARLQSAKRVDLAIRSFAELADADSSLRLLITGEGPERSALEQLCRELGVQDRVTFFGHVPHNQMVKMYNVADLLLLTSEKEGSPMVILEALACGTPVVATPAGDVAVLVQDGENGFVVHTASPSNVAQAIAKCLNRTWDRSALVGSIQHLTSTLVGDRLADLFVKVCKRNNVRNRAGVKV